MKPFSSRYPSMTRAMLWAGVAACALCVAVPPAAAEIGVTAAVNVDARSKAPGNAPRVLALGQKVVFNEQITTDASGQAQILLLDGTTFTVGPNSDLTIDEFVFNPETGDAKVVASVTKGAFRFIGAKTSQVAGGATINTPVGTIGVRGGSVVCSFSGEQVICVMPFGKTVDIVGKDGETHKLYKPGWLLAFDQNGNFVEERKATLKELGGLTAALDGKGKGGAITSPDDGTVENSEVGEANSELPNTIPVSVILEAVKSNPGVKEVENNAAMDDLDNAIDEEIAEEPEEPETFNARVLTAPADGYVIDPINGGGTVPNAGPRGLVGSTPDSDQNVAFVRQAGRLISVGGAIDLPDYSGTEGDGPVGPLYELENLFICDECGDSTATLGATPLEGVAYAGRGDFVAYLLGLDTGVGNPAERPAYFIFGTPTPDAQLAFDGDIREYSLTADPIAETSVPFFRDDLYGPVNPTYDADGPGGNEPLVALNSTNLIVVESNGGAARAFQSWVHITGEGAEQKSAAFLFSSGIGENEEGNLQLDGGRRGTFRHQATAGPVNTRGGVASIAGASGDHIFGENADHFVIGATPSPADSYSDVALDNSVYTEGFDGTYGTHHVASLVDETPMTEFSRTERTVTGFISGMGESSTGSVYILTNQGDPDGDGPLLFAPATNLTLNLDADTNTVQGEAELFDALGQDTVVASYLIGLGNSGTGGASAFVDDHVFGAQRDSDPARTRIRTDGGEGGPNGIAHTGEFTPGTYLVSGRANPIDKYQHLEGCSQCDFIDWGWWGTRVEAAAGASEEIPDDRVDYVHMGTWVAGDVSTDAEIEQVVGLPAFAGNVHYSGTVIGNVARRTESGTASYIATGDLGVNYSFGSRTGTMNIDNFDSSASMPGGVDLFGNITANATAENLLSGGLSGDNLYTNDDPYDTLNGSFSGAFVNSSVTPPDGGPNVAAGLIGNFDFGGADINAVGTVAGVRELAGP